MKFAKRSFLAILVAAPLSLGLFARDGGGWFVFAGPAFSDLTLPLVSGDKDYRLGVLAGAGYEVPLNGAFSLLVQAAYTTGGTHVDLSGTDEMTYSGSAITIPVMIRIKSGRGLAPFITAGGFAGWGFSPRLETDTDGASVDVPISGDDFRPFLYGVAAGLGLEFKLGPSGMFLHALYSYGLSDLARSGTGAVRPSALNLLVGFRF